MGHERVLVNLLVLIEVTGFLLHSFNDLLDRHVLQSEPEKHAFVDRNGGWPSNLAGNHTGPCQVDNRFLQDLRVLELELRLALFTVDNAVTNHVV